MIAMLAVLFVVATALSLGTIRNLGVLEENAGHLREGAETFATDGVNLAISLQKMQFDIVQVQQWLTDAQSGARLSNSPCSWCCMSRCLLWLWLGYYRDGYPRTGSLGHGALGRS